MADVPLLPARGAPLLQRVHGGAGAGVRGGQSETLDGQPVRRREPRGVARDGTRTAVGNRVRRRLPALRRSGGRGTAACGRHRLFLSRRRRAGGRAGNIRGAEPALRAAVHTRRAMAASGRDEDGGVVRGRCERGFEPVRRALAEILASGEEVGAALAVYLDGHPVLDLWGGYTDAGRTRPWERDTIVNLYSVGKAVTAVCALRLVEAGLLDLDAPVARYWPEFARAGKAWIPVRYLLTHQVGLPAVARPLPADAWNRWDLMTEALAAQAP